jgi:hypothetical protein
LLVTTSSLHRAFIDKCANNTNFLYCLSHSLVLQIFCHSVPACPTMPPPPLMQCAPSCCMLPLTTRRLCRQSSIAWPLC